MADDGTKHIPIPEHAEAVAWWIEEIHNESDVCFDLTTGETIAIRVTDANYGGVVE